MAKYWIFDADSEQFEQCTKRKAIDEHDDMPVIIHDNDELYIQEEGVKRRWPHGDHYELLGAVYDEDAFMGIF